MKIISIGCNCDVGLFIKKNYSSEYYPFDWIWSNIDFVIKTFETDYFEFTECDKLNAVWNPPHKHTYIYNNNCNGGEQKTCSALSLHDADNLNKLGYNLKIPIINEKFVRRFKRLYDVLNSNEDVILIRRVLDKDYTNIKKVYETTEKIIHLHKLLTNKFTANIHLYIVDNHGFIDKSSIHENIKIFNSFINLNEYLKPIHDKHHMDKVTVVIPTYNRFKYLMNTIQSVKEQTHTNIEIIVVNDCSTEKEYYEYDWNKNGVRIIHLPENSKTKFGFACPGGYQRNFGIKEATGEYVAFCDDDDTWFPQKLELQLKAMKENDCNMSCTDGLFGRGVYDETKTYKKYNKENYFGILKSIYKKRGSSLMDNGFPTIWTPDFFKVHNCAICSSMMIKKEVIDVVGDFVVARANEDYEYWRRAVLITNCVYVDEPCVYYDASHGAGQNY
jgi:GT2 family glycosyltransferase